jgi:glycosyltransferase involved in cell wall biosynthesis
VQTPAAAEARAAAAAAQDADGILLIAYHFPPSAAVGGRRAANFAAALRSLGWHVRALTIPRTAIEQLDESRLRSVDGVPVHEAAVWPTFAGALTAALRLGRRGGAPAPAAAAPAPTSPGKPRREPVGRRLRRYVMSFALLPDAEKGWIVPAVFAAVRTIRRHRLGWFMTSCPPYSVHLVGLLVKALTGARWVADFRDPWMTTGSKRLFPTCAASIAIESWLERQVMEKADIVVFNVDRLRHAYRSRYAHVAPEKFVFVPNAIAAEPSPLSAPRYDRFTICYTGSLYVGRSPVPVFEAVARLIADGAVAPGAVRILLVGQCRSIDGTPTDQVVRQHGLEAVVELKDHVPYDEAFEMVRRSHLALLLAPNLPYQIPAKVYDYLSAGTRILAIAEEGGTADLLRETEAGVAFAAGEADGIARFILDEMRDGTSSLRGRHSLARYSVDRITKDLVGHIRRSGPQTA